MDDYNYINTKTGYTDWTAMMDKMMFKKSKSDS
jgi:hypothetical protein